MLSICQNIESNMQYTTHVKEILSHVQNMSDICQANVENIEAICSILQAVFSLTYAEHILKKFVTYIKYRIAYAEHMLCTCLVYALHMHSVLECSKYRHNM